MSLAVLDSRNSALMPRLRQRLIQPEIYGHRDHQSLTHVLHTVTAWETLHTSLRGRLRGWQGTLKPKARKASL
jgi:hypothetical protein